MGRVLSIMMMTHVSGWGMMMLFVRRERLFMQDFELGCGSDLWFLFERCINRRLG